MCVSVWVCVWRASYFQFVSLVMFLHFCFSCVCVFFFVFVFLLLFAFFLVFFVLRVG